MEIPGRAGEQLKDKRQVADVHHLSETEDENEAAPHGWENLMEEAVDTLIEVSAAQHELMESHKRLNTKVANPLDRMISRRKEEHRPCHPTLPRFRRRPKPTTTTYQPPSARHGPSSAKKARHSSPHGGQRRN